MQTFDLSTKDGREAFYAEAAFQQGTYGMLHLTSDGAFAVNVFAPEDLGLGPALTGQP